MRDIPGNTPNAMKKRGWESGSRFLSSVSFGDGFFSFCDKFRKLVLFSHWSMILEQSKNSKNSVFGDGVILKIIWKLRHTYAT